MPRHAVEREWEGHFVCGCGLDFPTAATQDIHRRDRADVENAAGFLKSLAEPILKGEVGRLNPEYVSEALRLARIELGEEEP